MFRKLTISSVLALVAIGACGGPTVSPPEFVTHGLTLEDGLPMAQLNGRLEPTDGCLLIVNDQGSWVAALPEGSEAGPDSATVGAVEVAYGEGHGFGGGEVTRGLPALGPWPETCPENLPVWLTNPEPAGG